MSPDEVKAFKAFFDGDLKTQAFITANYVANEFDHSIFDTEDSTKNSTNMTMYKLMKAANYNASSKPAGMADDDIHQNIMDFVVRTALFHRQLDNRIVTVELSTEKNLIEEKVRNVLTGTGTAAMVSEGVRESEVVKFLLKNKVYEGNKFPNVVYKVVDEDNAEAIKEDARFAAIAETMSYYQLLTYVLAGIVNATVSKKIQLQTGNLDRKIDPDDKSVLQLPLIINNNIDNKPINTVRNYLKEIVSNPAYLSLSRDLELNLGPGSYLLKLPSQQEMESALIVHLLAIYNKLKNSAFTEKDVFDVASDKNLENNFINSIVNLAFTAKKRTLGNSEGYITLRGSPGANRLYNEVFANWENISLTAKAFYSANLILLVKTASGAWEKVPENEYSHQQNVGRENLRLNFTDAGKLDDAGNQTTVFSQSLPLIPSDLKNLWYTDKSGNKLYLAAGTYRPNVLRTVYNCVFNPELLCTIEEFPDLPNTFTPEIERNRSTWDLNSAFIVTSVLNAACQENPEDDAPGTFKTELTEVFSELWDMSSNDVWLRNEKGKLFTIENGKRVYCDDVPFKFEKLKCAGTVLNVQDEDQCKDLVANCLLSSPENLKECLDLYKNEDMFKLSQKELSGMHPAIAEKILESFHVKILPNQLHKNYPNVRVFMPQKFEDWEEEVLNSNKMHHDVRAAIKNNSALKEYLHGVIEFVRASPAILEENKDYFLPAGSALRNASVELDPAQNAYLAKLHRKFYKIPLPNTVQGLAFGSNYLLAGQRAFPNIVDNFRPLMFGGETNGIFQSGGGMSGNGRSYLNMTGGGASLSNDGVFGVLSQKLTNLFGDLQKGGLFLKPADKNRILGMIASMSKTEKKINEFIKVFRIIADMQKFVKAVGPNKYSSPSGGRTVSIERAMSYHELLEWLHKNAGEYEQKIFQNINFLNTSEAQLLETYNDLVNAIVIQDRQKARSG